MALYVDVANNISQDGTWIRNIMKQMQFLGAKVFRPDFLAGSPKFTSQILTRRVVFKKSSKV